MESPACKRWLTHKSLCWSHSSKWHLVEIGVAKSRSRHGHVIRRGCEPAYADAVYAAL